MVCFFFGFCFGFVCSLGFFVVALGMKDILGQDHHFHIGFL